jgi:hypothetical protein
MTPIFYSVTPCRPVGAHGIAEEPNSSIFRVAEYTKQVTSEKLFLLDTCLVYSSTLKMEALRNVGKPLSNFMS